MKICLNPYTGNDDEMEAAGADPLAGKVYPDRAHYATGVQLDDKDFIDEQTYHRGRLARSLAYLHGSGTAAGLEVEYVAPESGDSDRDTELIKVKPGVAIDRLGRVIEVPGACCIRLNKWYMQQDLVGDLRDGLYGAPYNGVVADVFIRFHTCTYGKTPAIFSGPYDATNGLQPSRVRDSYEIKLVVRNETTPPPPENQWAELMTAATVEEFKTELHKKVFNAYFEGSDAWDSEGLESLREYAPGQDTTSVFLARVVIPATLTEDSNRPPERDFGREVDVDNDIRPFVYSTGALVQWLEWMGKPTTTEDE